MLIQLENWHVNFVFQSHLLRVTIGIHRKRDLGNKKLKIEIALSLGAFYKRSDTACLKMPKF